MEKSGGLSSCFFGAAAFLSFFGVLLLSLRGFVLPSLAPSWVVLFFPAGGFPRLLLSGVAAFLHLLAVWLPFPFF